MINYSVDSSIRRTVIVVLFILSLLFVEPLNVLISLFCDLIINWLPFTEQFLVQLSKIGISLSGVSLLGVFGGLYYLFCEFLWKIKIITKLTKIPNLSGEWEGVLISSYVDPKTKKKKEPIDMTLEIKQNWNSMNIKAHFPDSDSYSKAVNLHTKDQKGTVLAFSYKNVSFKVDIDSREFSGYNELTYYENELKGIYFSNRNDGTHGTIKLKKKKESDK